jgi:YidC/Oxa1 family membrane protein insertase
MPSFLGVFEVDAAYHLVCTLTGVLTPVLGGLAAAAGIIVFTMAVRLLIAPLSFRALRGQAAQARLAPQLQALRQRYGRQPERFQRELTALYEREGTTMLAGVWPILAQWPFLSVMYAIFRSPRLAGGANQLLSHTVLGVPLGAHWLSGPGVLSAQGGIFLGAFAVLAALCWLSARVARRMATTPGGAPVPAAPRRATQRTPAAPEPAPAQGGVKVISTALPYVTVVFAAFMPLAAGLYLITTMAWSTAERWLFTRRAISPLPAGKQHGGEAVRDGRAALGLYRHLD